MAEEDTDHERKDIYPGVSSQTMVRIRTEQLFKEGQAKKPYKRRKRLKTKLQNKTNKELRGLEEEDKHMQQFKGNCDIADDKQPKLTCITSVGHEVERIKRDYKKRSNDEQAK
eukprot:7435048-Heterocapsa_arctica.AAC.1